MVLNSMTIQNEEPIINQGIDQKIDNKNQNSDRPVFDEYEPRFFLLAPIPGDQGISSIPDLLCSIFGLIS